MDIFHGVIKTLKGGGGGRGAREIKTKGKDKKRKKKEAQEAAEETKNPEGNDRIFRQYKSKP